MENKIIKFDYAAGKVTNAISGTYSETGSDIGDGNLVEAAIKVSFNANGAGVVQRLGQSATQETFTWYTGEMPVSGPGGPGETWFSITQTLISGPPPLLVGVYRSTLVANYDGSFVLTGFTENKNFLSTTAGVTVTGTILNDAPWYIDPTSIPATFSINLILSNVTYGASRVRNAVTLTRGGMSKTYNFDLVGDYVH